MDQKIRLAPTSRAGTPVASRGPSLEPTMGTESVLSEARDFPRTVRFVERQQVSVPSILNHELHSAGERAGPSPGAVSSADAGSSDVGTILYCTSLRCEAHSTVDLRACVHPLFPRIPRERG